MSAAAKSGVIVFLVAAVLGFGWWKYSDFLHQGRKAPESAQILNKLKSEGVPSFTLDDLNGQSFGLETYRGKLVILNFWAAWCDPCVAEFPSLLKLIDNFKGEVILIAISADHEEKDIHNFLKAFKANSPHIRVAWDKDYTIAKLYGTEKLPESYIIGREGQLIRKVSGVDDWATPDAFEYFEHLLSDDGLGTESDHDVKEE